MKKITKAILAALAACAIGAAGCEKKDDDQDLPDARYKPQHDRTIEALPPKGERQLLPIKERAEAAAKEAGQSEKDYSDAKKIVGCLIAYNYKKRKTLARGGDLIERKMSLPGGYRGNRPVGRDEAEELIERLTAKGNYALAVIAEGLQRKIPKEAKIQIFRALEKSDADRAIVDDLLLWGMASGDADIRYWAYLFIRNAQDGSAILPGLVEIAASDDTRPSAANYCLMLIYEFQYKNGLEPMLAKEQLKALRDQYKRQKKLLKEGRSDRRKITHETTAVLLARVIAESKDSKVKADLCGILWEKFIRPGTNTEVNRHLTALIMRFFADKKTIEGAERILLNIVTARTVDGQQPRYYCDVREAFRALGEIAAAKKEEEDKGEIVHALSQMLARRIMPDIAMEAADALANAGGAGAVTGLLEGCRINDDPLVKLYCARGLEWILRDKKADGESLHQIVKETFARWPSEKNEPLMATWIRLLGAARNGVADEEETGKAIADLRMILQEIERSAWIRGIAAEELGNYDLKEVREALVLEYGRTDNAEIHYFIIKALGKVGDSKSARMIISVALNADSAIIEACSRSLAMLLREGEFGLDDLMTMYTAPGIGHGQKRNLLECLAHIGGADDPKAVDPVDEMLITIFANEQSEDLKSQALYFINQRFRPGAMPGELEGALTSALRSGRKEAYFFAVILLTKLGSKESLPLIAGLLGENDIELPVRRAVYQAMYAMGGADEIPLILNDIKDYAVLKILSDSRAFAHVEAAKNAVAMFEIDLRRKEIADLIDNATDEDLRFAAILTTTDFAPGEFVDRLTAILKNEKSSARAIGATLMALGLKGRREVLPEIAAMVKCDDPELVAAAAFALGKLRVLDGAEPLVAALAKENALPEHRRNQNLIDLIVGALSNVADAHMWKMGTSEEHRAERIKALGDDAAAWRVWLDETK